VERVYLHYAIRQQTVVSQLDLGVALDVDFAVRGSALKMKKKKMMMMMVVVVVEVAGTVLVVVYDAHCKLP
jgi:hypothetical protein